MVSICCVTYNHENYIKQALDGFLMQKTNFPVEIIVHDDASTDNTSKIIREYASRYPQIIPVIQPINLMSKGQNPTIDHCLLKAKGKYIALCEGDDYWTDPYKLQKQVDFLERNASYTLVTHDVEVIGLSFYSGWFTLDSTNRDLLIEDWIMGYPAQTASYLFRNDKYLKFIPDWFFKLRFGDIALVIFILAESKKKSYWMNDKMSVYRINCNGISFIQHSAKFEDRIEERVQHLTMFKIIENNINKDPLNNKNIFNEKIYSILLEISTLYWYTNRPIQSISYCFKALSINPIAIDRHWFNLIFSAFKQMVKNFLSNGRS